MGDAFLGVCHAHPDDIHQPPVKHQEDICNCGYARGLCDRFPPDASADAVRFSVLKDEQRALRLAYIFEREHAPVNFGVLEYSIAEHAFQKPATTALLGRQAEAFIESYLALTRGSKRAGAAAK